MTQFPVIVERAGAVPPAPTSTTAPTPTCSSRTPSSTATFPARWHHPRPFAYPVFRRVYFGALLSNIGTWMQNVILGAFVYQQTSSATWVALISLAQLGPLLVLSLAGGALADRFDRRTVLIIVSFEQLVFSFALRRSAVPPPQHGCAAAGRARHRRGRAIYTATYSALIPTLVAARRTSPGRSRSTR